MSRSSPRKVRAVGTSAVTETEVIRSVRNARRASRSRHQATRYQWVARADVAERLDLAQAGGALAVAVARCAARGGWTARRPPCAASDGTAPASPSRWTRPARSLGRGGVVTLHRRDQLAQRRARGRLERRPLQPPQRHRHRDGLPRRQVDRRQRTCLVEAVAARATGLGIDRHPRLLQRVDVPLDRAHTDLEAAGQPPRATRTRRDRPQLLDQGIEAIGTVHTRQPTSGV